MCFECGDTHELIAGSQRFRYSVRRSLVPGRFDFCEVAGSCVNYVKYNIGIEIAKFFYNFSKGQVAIIAIPR